MIYPILTATTKQNRINYRGFVLSEILIVSILIFIIYYLAFASFNTMQSKPNILNLTNLKQILQKMDFDNKAVLKCIDNEKVECFYVLDDIVQKKRFTGLFKRCPTVYEYSKKQNIIYFKDMQLKYFETLPICFEFEVKKNGQSSQMILETSNGVFIYDGISNKPVKIEYIGDVSTYFYNKINEVKDAF
jgi:hypothetical protein